MGHRANFVVIRDSSAKAFHDQWAALGCIFVLEEGPEVAEAEVQKYTPTEELLDWCWAEGGYLIDYDRRILMAFGMLGSDLDEFVDEGDEGDEEEQEGEELEADGVADTSEEESAREAKAFLEKIAPKWAGWRLRWDQRGVDAFAAHLTERRITTIKTQKESHPAKPLQIEHQA